VGAPHFFITTRGKENSLRSLVALSSIWNDSQMEVKKLAHEHVLKITSGQVIISLASATKELIENSLDAGASSVGALVHYQL
jgi:hypothetical protein